MVRNTGLFTVVMALATFVVVVDNTIMNVSINALVRDLNTTISGVQAAISLNALIMAAFVLMGGKLADIIGIKRTFLFGSFAYIVGTVIASMSNNLPTFMLGWCAIQGVGAAMMLPNVQTAIREYISGEARAKSYGILGGVNALGVAVGPIFGGFLTTFFSWRWAFAVEILIMGTMLVMSGVIPADVLKKVRPNLDRMGVALQACAMILLVLGVLLIGDYGLFFARQPLYIGNVNLAFFGLSPALYSFLLGVIFTLLFMRWEHHLEDEQQPTLLSLTLFENDVFSNGIKIASIQTMMIAGVLFTIPLFLQVTYGLNPLQSGFYLLPLSISVLVFALLGVRLGRRTSMKAVMLLGWLVVILSAAVLLLRMSEGSEPQDLILGLAVFGTGMGLLSSQTSNVVMSSIKREESAEASGALNTFQQLGNSVGVAILGTILSVTLVYNLTTQVEQSAIAAEKKPVVIDELKSGVEIASTAYVEEAVAQKTSDEQAASVAAIYSSARTGAFQVTALAIGFFAIIALILTTEIPKKLEEPSEEGEPARSGPAVPASSAVTPGS
jgi:MFS family permease